MGTSTAKHKISIFTWQDEPSSEKNAGLNRNMLKSVILSVDQMREAERNACSNGISSFDLIASAGVCAFEVVRELYKKDERILVACGSGNTGGKGLIAAQLLNSAGYDISVALLGQPEFMTGDARQALDKLDLPLTSLSDTNPAAFTLIVDALLGMGINRPVSGELAQWINQANSCNASIVSIEIPTGISGDSGSVMGTSIKAKYTVTYFRKKIGHILYPGKHHCGNIHVCQIGIEPFVLDTFQPNLFENTQELWSSALPEIGWHSHKYTRGHTVVVAGHSTSTGAARLAARSALRSGAGLVTLACPTSSAHVVAAHVTAEMIRIINSPTEFENMLADNRISAVVLGPGMGVGANTREMVKTALSSNAAIVLDADALTSFEHYLADLIDAISGAKNDVILTPHAGELQRLFGKELAPRREYIEVVSIFKSKIELTQAAARLCNATVLFKGPDTVIASSDGSCMINTNAPPWLATAGSGDVLSGTIAGWLSQGVSPFMAAGIGCWMHAEAANLVGPGLIATDIVKQYQAVHRLLR